MGLKDPNKEKVTHGMWKLEGQLSEKFCQAECTSEKVTQLERNLSIKMARIKRLEEQTFKTLPWHCTPIGSDIRQR